MKTGSTILTVLAAAGVLGAGYAIGMSGQSPGGLRRRLSHHLLPDQRDCETWGQRHLHRRHHSA